MCLTTCFLKSIAEKLIKFSSCCSSFRPYSFIIADNSYITRANPLFVTKLNIGGGVVKKNILYVLGGEPTDTTQNKLLL